VYIQSTAWTRIHEEVYLVLRNRKVRQVYGKYAVSVPPLPSAGHWNILHAPRHNIYFGPRLYSAGLAFRGVCVGVPVCGCEGLSLAAEERARMTRVQLFEIHFNIILAKAGTGRDLLVPSQNYCKYFLFRTHVSQADTRPFHHYRLGLTPCSLVTN